MERSSEVLTAGAGQRSAVGEHDPRPQVQAHRPGLVLEGPAVAEERREVALRVGRHERLEDVGQDLVLLGGDVGRPARSPRRGWPWPRRACRPLGISTSAVLFPRRERFELRLVLAPPARTRRAGWRRWRRARGACPCRSRALRPTRAASRPRSTQRRASSIRRACQAVSAAKRSAAPAGPGLRSLSRAPSRRPPPRAARRRRCPPCAGRGRAASARRPSSDGSPDHSSSSRYSSAIFATRIASSGLNVSSDFCASFRPYSTVLSGDIGLREVVDQLGVDALEPARRSASRSARRTCGAGSAACGARAPRRGHRGRSRSRTSAGRRATPAPLRGSRRAASGRYRRRGPSCPSARASRSRASKVLPSTEAIESSVAQLFGKPLDPLLDRLLDRRGQGVGGDLRLFRKAPGPVSSREMPPESMSDRISSLVKNGFPSVASWSRRARSSATFGAPTRDATSDRCSDGENGPSVMETKRGSSAKESSMRIKGCRLSVSVCR